MKKNITLLLTLSLGMFVSSVFAQQNNPKTTDTKPTTTTVREDNGTKNTQVKPTDTNKPDADKTMPENGTSNKMAVNEEGVTEEKQGGKTTTNTKIAPK